jgi:hypothetical protein
MNIFGYTIIKQEDFCKLLHKSWKRKVFESVVRP